MGVSVSTLRALEAGAPGVSIGKLAMALLALGILSRLDDLTELGKDDIGLLMEIEALPKRIRIRKSGRRAPAGSSQGGETQPKGVLL